MKKYVILAALMMTSIFTVAQTEHAINTSKLSVHDQNAPIGWATVDGSVTGGDGENEVTVSTLDALTSALSGTGKKTIYVSGTIEFSGSVSIKKAANKTVIGLPDAVLSNPTHSAEKSESGILTFSDCQNIILRNLTFKGAGAYDIDGYDNLTLTNCQYVWVDHCDFQDGVDGNFDCNNGSDNICVSWCRFRYLIAPWSGGSGGSNDHRFSNLWGGGDENAAKDEGKLRTTFVNCWWDEGCKQRMPRIRFGQVHMLNCLYNSSIADYAIGAGYRCNAYVENCYFDGPNNPWYIFATKDNYTDYNITLTGNYGASDEQSSSGSISFFTPTYDYTAYEASQVLSVVSDSNNGAGATLQFGTDEATVAYSIEGLDCEGELTLTGGTYAAGDQYTIPAKNFTLYKEGYTLTGWTDGTNTYAAGETITLAAGDMTLTPVFTANTVSLADRTEAVELNFSFRRDQGAPIVKWQNTNGHVWVTQATVNGQVIDVPMTIDTNPGKFNNANNEDWTQVNEGTKFTIPSCKGATISMEAYNIITTTTIDGQTDYTQGKTVNYEIGGNAETVDVVIGDGSYYRYILVALPVVQQQGGTKYTNEAAAVVWPMDTPADYTKNVTTPEDVFATVGVVLGDVRLMDQNGNENATGTSNVSSGVTFSQMRPTNGGSDYVTWTVKPKAGLTFIPKKITAYIVRFGTDAKDGVTFTAKAGESNPVTLGTFTAPRNNKNQADDKYGDSNNYAVNGFVEINLTEAQQTSLATGETLSVMGTIGVGNSKAGGIAQVTISGEINGTVQEVETYTLDIAANPTEGGSVTKYPNADEYEAGANIKVTATEYFGYDFVNWTDADGNEVSTDPVYSFDIAKSEMLTANFQQVNTYELALAVDGTNDYMVTVNPAPTMVDDKMMYEEGTTVVLTANQYDGLVTFTNWSDGTTNSEMTVTMDADKDITASYAQADIIAGWDFYKAGGSGRKADFAAQDNDADALSLVNTETGETSGWLDKSTLGGGGYESFKGAAVNWRTGSQNGDVGNWHWQTKVNAEAFTDINVQFQMLYNYNAYQTYDAEYSLDGENWTKFGSITMTGTKQAVQFSEQLPAEANNQAALYIRMLADKTSNVDGAASANDGNTLAMFFITGTPKLVNDGVAPVLVSTVPENGATGASASGKIVLTFDERVKVAEGATATLAAQTLTPAVSGKTVTFEYKGLDYSTEYTFTLPANSVADLTDNYIDDPISLSFTTMARPTVTKGLYDAVVENVDQLMAAINEAAARADKNVRYRIFIKNGEYTIPLASTIKTVNGYEVPECITFLNTSNVSFIGESRDGVIITNGIEKDATFAGQYGSTSKYDGIGNSDVFQIGSSASGLYWQDLTVETGMDDATGRDIAIQDKGTMNIYKNVGLSGYQDTWTSNNDNGLYYFEDGYVRGRTDYMCGKGDIFWNRVELRQIAGGYAAVPSKPAKYGWIYKDCVINGEGSGVDGNYTLGRPWGSGTPIALFIDTKMNVVPSAIGWNEMSGGWPARFAEYNSMTSTGSVIDLSGRKKTFGDGHENNPVLTAEEALENSNLHRMFGDWDPTLATEQAPVPTNVKVSGKQLIWDDNNYTLLYAVCKDGKVIDFTTEAQYAVSDEGEYTVRAANEMGGLSEASAVASFTTGIENVEPTEPVSADDTIYNLQGVRVNKATKGLYIVNGRKVVMK